MSKHCEYCGERVYSRGCVNCHEASYIAQQYEDNLDPVPDSILQEIKKENKTTPNPSFKV